MNKLLTTLAIGAATFVGGIGTVQAQDNDGAPDFVPVEVFTCNYRERKDQSDFDRAVALLEEASATEGAGAYSAWRLFPMFYGPDQDFDFIFFAAWPDGATMGGDYQNYLQVGSEAEEAWEEAVDCNTATIFASLNIMEPADDEDDFVLTFSDCNLHEGRSNEQAVAAMRSFADYRKANGSSGGTWVWFPAYGGGAADFDFKLLNGHADMQAFGNYFQWFTDNQAYRQMDALTNGLVDCGPSRVYRGETLYSTWPEM